MGEETLALLKGQVLTLLSQVTMPVCVRDLSLKAIGLFWLKWHGFSMCSGPGDVSSGLVLCLPAVSSAERPVTQEGF